VVPVEEVGAEGVKGKGRQGGEGGKGGESGRKIQKNSSWERERKSGIRKGKAD
jgi:hypothetical protein